MSPRAGGAAPGEPDQRPAAPELIEFVLAGARQSLDVPPGTVFLRSDPEAGVLLQRAPQGALLRLSTLANGRRIEPIAAGALLVVSGVEVFCKDLEDGDWFQLGGLRVSWRMRAPEAPGPMAAAPAPAVRRSAAPAAAVGAERASRRGASERAGSRARPRNNGVPWLVLLPSIAVGLLLVFAGLRLVDAAASGESPEQSLQLARLEFERGDFERSLAHLDAAKARGGPALLREVEALAQKVRAMQQRRLDDDKSRVARDRLAMLQRFAARYLQGAPSRPAARECVRLCDAALAELAADGVAAASELQEIAALRARWLPQCGLPAPDALDDVLFRVEAHRRFVVREYAPAVRALRAFAAVHADDEAAQRALSALVGEAQGWLVEQFQKAEAMLARGEGARASGLLRDLEQSALLPEWTEQAARLQALQAQAEGAQSPR